ncbi:hypothetical protein ACE6H2_024077 [Prunus campanulata]
MYQCDPNYRILHDGVSDLFTDCLKSDIQNLNKHHQQQQSINDDDEDETSAAECLEITSAGLSCPDFDSDFNRNTLLCESIAKKVFPRESYPEYLGVEESDYTDRVRQRLIKEVLVPLRKALEDCDLDEDFNRWGYKRESKREPCAVNGGGELKIEAGALLPHEIACYANDRDVGKVAELQWKAMVEHIRKQGKFKNCLAVYDNYGNAAVALAMMISELSEEPWKGKLMNFSRNPQMHSLQGDLKAKLQILKRMDIGSGRLIWRKFKDKGYGDEVPQIVFWKANNCMPAYAPYAQHGMVMMNRFNDNLVKSFLDNDGKIGRDHVMEAAISDPRYQNIVVVD